MPEICTQSIISANHKSKANSHPCILESVVCATIVPFLDRDVKIKKITIQLQALCFQRLLW